MASLSWLPRDNVRYARLSQAENTQSYSVTGLHSDCQDMVLSSLKTQVLDSELTIAIPPKFKVSRKKFETRVLKAKISLDK